MIKYMKPRVVNKTKLIMMRARAGSHFFAGEPEYSKLWREGMVI